jgi:predicted RNA-binding protein associated with RNAse of E/G family
MMDKMMENDSQMVIENWIKPPRIVQYSNSSLVSFDEEKLVCEFLFPEKYSKNPFFINGNLILNPGDMYRGRRTFYADRFYALLEYYSVENNLTAYYLDITLPPILQKESVLILDMKIDFWVFPDKENYIILDQNELDDAIKLKLFDFYEIESCRETTAFIKGLLDQKKFDEIFTSYKKSSYRDWERYSDYLEYV